MRQVAIAVMMLGASGCAVVGPSCIERRQSGHVATLNGSVAAGGVARHAVTYASEGSQNDVHLTWPGQLAAAPPRLAFYATRATCEAFDPAAPLGPCAILGRGRVGRRPHCHDADCDQRARQSGRARDAARVYDSGRRRP